MGTRVQRVKTEVSEAQMAQAMIEAWRALFKTEPTKEQISILLAQNAFETGHRKSMWNYNVGNITLGGANFDYFDDLATNEQTSPGQWKKMNLKYRAYPTLVEGAKDYLRFLSGKRYSNAWQAVLAADPVAFSKSLKQSGYYTADEAPYTKGLVGIFNKINKSDSFDKAHSGAVSSPKELPTAKLDTINTIDQLNNYLDKYLSALGADNNGFLIRVKSGNINDSIEYSRILCNALKDELSCFAFTHTDNNSVEIECSINGNRELCDRVLKSVCNDISSAFEYATRKIGGIKVSTQVSYNKKSLLEPINIKKSEMNYRQFHLKMLAGK